MLLTPPASPTLNGLCEPEHRIGWLIASRFRLTGIIGVGAYGVVYTAVDVRTNQPVAVKALNKIGLEPRQRKFQQREIELHLRASAHRNVVSLVNIFDAPDCTYVVLEYCPEGDLFSNITERGQYVGDDARAKDAFLQILDAVEFCHSVGIYHRDLKPENILVTEDGNTVKLADFGLATPEHFTSDFGCGSTFYMSPECQQTSPKAFTGYYSAPNDIWSVGVILVNLTCGRNPWKRASFEDSTFRAYMKDPKFLRSILPLSPELDRVLRRIFEYNPVNRISIPELRELIQQCSRFTTTSKTVPEPAPAARPVSPPYTSEDFARDLQFQDLYHHQQAQIQAQAQAQMQYLSPPASPTSSVYSGDSTFSEPDYSPRSSISSNSSTSSFTYVHAPVPQAPVQTSYVSPQNNWLYPIRYVNNFVKHVSPNQLFHPVQVCS